MKRYRKNIPYALTGTIIKVSTAPANTNVSKAQRTPRTSERAGVDAAIRCDRIIPAIAAEIPKSFSPVTITSSIQANVGTTRPKRSNSSGKPTLATNANHAALVAKIRCRAEFLMSVNVGVGRHAAALRREAYAHQHASRRNAAACPRRTTCCVEADVHSLACGWLPSLATVHDSLDLTTCPLRLRSSPKNSRQIEEWNQKEPHEKKLRSGGQFRSSIHPRSIDELSEIVHGFRPQTQSAAHDHKAHNRAKGRRKPQTIEHCGGGFPLPCWAGHSNNETYDKRKLEKYREEQEPAREAETFADPTEFVKTRHYQFPGFVIDQSTPVPRHSVGVDRRAAALRRGAYAHQHASRRNAAACPSRTTC
jgi:hypothetical protein